MKSAVFSFSTDANLIPKHRNLCRRNGIFYFRKMVAGKRIFKSLKTDDPYLARHLLNRILLAELFPSSHKVSLNKTQFAIFNVDFCKINTLPFDEKNVVLKSSKKIYKPKVAKMNPNQNINTTNATVAVNGHKIMDIWNQNASRRYVNQRDFRTATGRLQRMVDFLGVETVEEVYETPRLLDNMFTGLENYTYRGKGLTKNTVCDYVSYLSQVINVALVNKWVVPDASVTLRLSPEKYIFKNWTFGVSKTRVPLSDNELATLFKALYKIKNKEFDFIDKAMNMSQYDKSLLQYIKDFPETITFVILLALFTGARANAAITIRIRDVDSKEKTVFFRIDKQLVAKKDIREMQKALKNNDAERMLPVSDIIRECGFWEYVSEQRAKYGSAAFVFEDAIANQNGQGYRTQNVNEAVNELLKLLGFKSAISASEMLDMHSFKETFYTVNGNANKGLSRDLLEAFAGNAPSSPSISSQNYNKPTYQRHKPLFINAAKIITFPHVEELFGGELPDGLMSMGGDINSEKETKSTAIPTKKTDADNQQIFDMLGFRLPDDYEPETESVLDYADSISDDADVVRATIAQKYKNLSDSELISRLFRCDEIFTSCTGENKTIWHTPMATARLASIEWGKLYIAYNERYKKNPHIYDLYERACDTINPSRFESRPHSPIQ